MATRSARPAAPRNPIGAHVPVAGGLDRAGLGYAARVAAEAVQVFVANPRGWATADGRPDQDEAFRAHCAERGLRAFVHAPYLINFGGADQATRERSAVSLRHSLRRGREIGAEGVVVHTGAATGGTDCDTALAQVRAGLLPLLDELADDAPDLLLEPTAGQGSSLCSRMADLAPYLDALDRHERVGVCLDTCHAFAAGEDLAAEDGAAACLDALAAAAGPGRLRLVHANDSKSGLGSRLDRHQTIGEGTLGTAPFRALLAHPATAGVPFVAETPGGEEGHAADIATLKSLR